MPPQLLGHSTCHVRIRAGRGVPVFRGLHVDGALLDDLRDCLQNLEQIVMGVVPLRLHSLVVLHETVDVAST